MSSLIAPFTSGLVTSVESWLAPLDSFRDAKNIHVDNGVIEKRGGTRPLAQIQEREQGIEIVGIAQDLTGTTTTGIPHDYASGDRVYIDDVVGMVEVNGLVYTITVVSPTDFELNIDTSIFAAYVSDGESKRLQDSVDRVMGIFRFLDERGFYDTLAFNTTQASILNSVSKTFDPLDSEPIMSGGEFDYIWAVNWSASNINNRLYFTNGLPYDGSGLNGIRYYDASGTGLTTVDFNDRDLGGGRTLYGGKLLFVLKQRLLILHTFEHDGAETTGFPQRARWCKSQGPSIWDDITPGGGGYVDCPTGDQIVSARSLQNSVVVMFTNSVWTINPVSDPALPFAWSKVNDFRACGGKFATVGYDKDVRSIGLRGITATDGTNTQRIDQKISRFVVNAINENFFEKVYCKRNYTTERWWTLYPSNEAEENDSALIYDDDSGAFTVYEIALSCLGYGNFGEDFRLSDFTAENDLDLTLDEAGDSTLQDYFWQDSQEAFLGGTISGTVVVLDAESSDSREPISASFATNAWNPHQKDGVEVRMPFVDIFVDTDTETTGVVRFSKDNDISPYTTQTVDFLPNLDYVASIINISQSNPAIVNSPSNGLTKGEVIYIYLVSGMSAINGGPYTIGETGENFFELEGVDSTLYSPYVSGGQVVRRSFYKTKAWKRIFAGGIGYEHFMEFSSSGFASAFRIHAFRPMFSPTGKRTIN
jgi:hypothetical protein